MRRWMGFCLAAGIAGGLAGGVAAAAITGPQTTLPTETITIVNQHGKRFVFKVEQALTPKQQEVGLMFRKSVAADGGMIFPWSPPQVSEMWMKNTLVPLDMVFVGPHGTIRHIANDTVPQSLRIISSRVPVAATIELQGGITAKDDIDVGDKVIGPQFGNGK
ncbi:MULTISPECIES: DUF192 domain-containing protein [unclassified Acidiphilium]|uniref:DUF192 domain-containing protein n=1 Tax=unclassified Acidiphilium TaxID=2617493 RepID=UPI000BD9E397|nr:MULTISPECIES: DUF192 domain-containing protein [unclassified Acidiphilium]OYV57045.1 MAG: hypothetical protein B7Z76_03800 [Acidiphilium sp. 20-67-58]HQT61786.1 DUF192 domain-containing protein [Acidiphilium sp.]